MINVITVHWMSAKWIPIQLAYLERNINVPYRILASLNGIDDPDMRRRFDYVQDVENASHPEKLNILSEVAVERSKPEDLLLFLDGDAFPVQPLQPWLDETLAEYPLVAVQRRENCEDLRPHPSFCVTTVRFWKELGCNWTGDDWITPTGDHFYDAGSALARILDAHGIEWLPLLRANTKDLHPLWYAVYGHRVYHHGAGFRDRVSKVDLIKRPTLFNVNSAWDGPSAGQLGMVLKSDPSALKRVRMRHVVEFAKAARRTLLRRFTREVHCQSRRGVRRGLRKDRARPSLLHEIRRDAGLTARNGRPAIKESGHGSQEVRPGGGDDSHLEVIEAVASCRRSHLHSFRVSGLDSPGEGVRFPGGYENPGRRRRRRSRGSRRPMTRRSAARSSRLRWPSQACLRCDSGRTTTSAADRIEAGSERGGRNRTRAGAIESAKALSIWSSGPSPTTTRTQSGSRLTAFRAASTAFSGERAPR